MNLRVFLKLVVLTIVIALILPEFVQAQQTLTIGSFDQSRSRAPFATATGTLGYGRLRSSLLNSTNFGSNGVVQCNIIIAPGTPTITAAYLADKDVLFTSVFTGALSASEAAAIRDFVANGGCVIVDANSARTEQTAADSLLAAIGTTATIGPGTACTNQTPTGGTITNTANALTNGPFGNIAGGPFGVSLTATLTTDGRDVVLMTCNDTGQPGRAFFPFGAISPGSGLVMYGGDPAAFDLFTVGFIFQPNNEAMYLNAIARCCARIIDIDIEPHFCPNFLDIKSNGVISVAIVGTPNLDVSTIDPDSVRLEGIAPVGGRDKQDVTRPVVGRQNVCDCTTGGDDIADLSFTFSIPELRVALGDLEPVDEVEVVLTLTGTLRDGTPFEGKDCVIIKSKRLSKSVTESKVSVPESYALAQNYPNPFNPETEITFQLPQASQVVVRIFNTLGQEIRTLVDSPYTAGFHTIRWNSKDNNGNAVSSGIYLYQLQAGSFSQNRKMTLLR